METPRRILVVDDEPGWRKMLGAMLTSLGHKVETAQDGFEALARVSPDTDLILLDAMMPGIDGFEVARRIREEPELADTPILMVTGLASEEYRRQALEAGVDDFINKPPDLCELQARTNTLLRLRAVAEDHRKHRNDLTIKLRRRTARLRRALMKRGDAERAAHRAQVETIERLGVAAEYKDEATGSHIRRLGHYCALLARACSLPPGEVETILHASRMHDVGKIGIPDLILLKPGPLSQDEWLVMKEHAAIGARILGGSSSELLRAGEVIARTHHERWDGGGYPAGLAADAIPLPGRICAVADVFDALTTRRPYKKAFSNEHAYDVIRQGRGNHFDPELVDCFLERTKEVVEVQNACATAEHVAAAP